MNYAMSNATNGFMPPVMGGAPHQQQQQQHLGCAQQSPLPQHLPRPSSTDFPQPPQSAVETQSQPPSPAVSLKKVLSQLNGVCQPRQLPSTPKTEVDSVSIPLVLDSDVSSSIAKVHHDSVGVGPVVTQDTIVESNVPIVESVSGVETVSCAKSISNVQSVSHADIPTVSHADIQTVSHADIQTVSHSDVFPIVKTPSSSEAMPVVASEVLDNTGASVKKEVDTEVVVSAGVDELDIRPKESVEIKLTLDIKPEVEDSYDLGRLSNKSTKDVVAAEDGLATVKSEPMSLDDIDGDGVVVACRTKSESVCPERESSEDVKSETLAMDVVVKQEDVVIKIETGLDEKPATSEPMQIEKRGSSVKKDNVY